MPKPPLPTDVVTLLKQPNPAVMATVRPDGTPVSVATWYLWDDESGRILLNLDGRRKRLSDGAGRRFLVPTRQRAGQRDDRTRSRPRGDRPARNALRQQALPGSGPSTLQRLARGRDVPRLALKAAARSRAIA
jgi:hypothetical protein